MPEGLDWEVWRLVTSERLSASLSEIEERWSMCDVFDAHQALDLYEDLAALARKS